VHNLFSFNIESHIGHNMRRFHHQQQLFQSSEGRTRSRDFDPFGFCMKAHICPSAWYIRKPLPFGPNCGNGRVPPSLSFSSVDTSFQVPTSRPRSSDFVSPTIDLLLIKFFSASRQIIRPESLSAAR
jgi:hypothetical protein